MGRAGKRNASNGDSLTQSTAHSFKVKARFCGHFNFSAYLELLINRVAYKLCWIVTTLRILIFDHLNLKKSVESRKSIQDLDAPDKIKNTLFTNQVTGNAPAFPAYSPSMAITTVFFISPCTSIPRLKAPTVGIHLFRAQMIFLGYGVYTILTNRFSPCVNLALAYLFSWQAGFFPG